MDTCKHLAEEHDLERVVGRGLRACVRQHRVLHSITTGAGGVSQSLDEALFRAVTDMYVMMHSESELKYTIRWRPKRER